MKKLKDILKESNVQIGKVYSNPYATAFVKENEEQEEPQMELSEEQKKAFLEAVKQYKKYGEAVYRNAGLGEVYESIKNMVEMAGKVTISETDDWFDNVTVSRHMKRMGESFKVFEKTLKEVSTLQQRLESSYDEIGEVLGKYYEISEELDPVGKEDGDIDNDGDEDASDEYLANRRKVISKAIKNESMKLTDMISVNEDVWTSTQKKQVEKLDNEFRNLLAKKGIEPYSYTASKMWKSAGFQKNFQQIFQKDESVNEASEEFVVYVEKDNGRKKLLHTKKSQRAANMFLTKNADKILNQSGIRTIGSMSKFHWEKDEEQYAENIKKTDMKTVTKKEWDTKHKDYKGMIKGQPYMMYMDKKGTTVYGPVNIVESVNEAKYDIGMARKGNGITIYNRAEEEAGDYKNVAHISDNGVVKYYDKKLPNDVKKKIEAEASKMKESVNEIRKGSIVMPYAMDTYGEFIVDKVFKNKDGETSYTGKFKKSGETKEFILHSKDKIVKESVNEGKKRFNIKYGVGKSKYVVNYHDGVKKHKDGSDFFDVEILKNQKDLEAFKKALLQKGFVAESVNESKSMKLTDMLKESFGFGELPSSKLMKMKVPAKQVLKEGTRSQVGYIDNNGNIKSAYVHFDGYPENMKPGIKKHMKSEKDVKTLIKRGGARGIFDDKDIEYYDDKSAKPMSGNLEDIEKYIKDSDFKGGAEFVYLYNTKDKKWYFADTYKDKQLKKLY